MRPLLARNDAASASPGEWELSAAQIADMQAYAAEAVQLLKHMAHESRLLILCYLWEQELSVGEINARVRLSQSALSQHLALLRAEGLVSFRRQAQNIYYRLADPKAIRVLAVLHELYCREEGRAK